MTDLSALVAELGPIATLTDRALRRQRSRDFYWYSPVLKRQLDETIADLVVLPATEAEVIATLAACHARGVPVTPRGTGTGNYGQAMPLRGGVVLDLSRLTALGPAERGRIRAGAGAKIVDIDEHCRRTAGLELRMHPSTHRTASLGGFVCGGSGGIGSVTWGGLRDRGNVLGLRVVTMEESPRVLELRGDDVHKVIHAYGTTGVVTEVEMPLAPAYRWIDAMIGFDDFAVACRFAHALASQDALLKKLVAVAAAPIPRLYFRHFRGQVPDGASVVLAMIADLAMEPFEALLRDWPGRVLHRGDGPEAGILPPLFEYSWNHTTLQALKLDRSLTYHQVLYPAPDHLDRVARTAALLGDDVMTHLEFVRFDGQVACFGLPLIRFTTEARLAEIAAIFESHGCPTFSPHHYTLEEGGMKRVDPVQLAFKREADPRGLLNPGKMLAWERPDYDAAVQGRHLFPAAG